MKKILIIILVLVLLVIGYFVFKPNAASYGEQLNEKEVSEIVSNVQKLIVVPEDDQPLVATIVNADELIAQQPFYQNVKNGDVLIIYPTVQKAILFNPDDNILINVGPLQVNESDVETPPQPPTPPPPPVETPSSDEDVEDTVSGDSGEDLEENVESSDQDSEI